MAAPLHRLARRWSYVNLTLARDQGIEREKTGSEDESNERGKEESKWIGDVELSGIAEDGSQGHAVRSDVGHQHVSGEQEADETRSQSNDEQDAAEELKRRDGRGHQTRQRDAEAGEEVVHVRKIVQFAPACLHELPSPIESDEEQKRRAKEMCRVTEAAIEAAQTGGSGGGDRCGRRAHLGCAFR